MPHKTLLLAGCLNTPVPHFATSDGRGIAVYSFDETSGKLSFQSEFTDVRNPTYLALIPEKHLLCATSELFGETEGTVNSYRIDAERGTLSPLNRQSTRGSLSAHCNSDHGGRCVVVSNYAHETPGELPGRHVVSYAIDDNGFIGESASEFVHEGSGPDSARQGVPHAHCSVPSRDDHYMLVSDLGTDSMLTYRMHASTGRLEGPVSSLQMPPGSGPRHFVFHPDGRTVYVANELSATVSRLAFNKATGALTMMETTPGLAGQDAALTPPADVHVAPDGRFLYVSFRGADCIAAYALDPHDGAIGSCTVCAIDGIRPRSFALSPDGRYLIVAHQDSGSIATFRLDLQSGALAEQVDSVDIGTPMCVKIARFAVN